MESKQVQTLYTLKEIGAVHLKAKRFNSASVYFLDIITKFDEAIQLLQTEQDVEKLIRQTKMPAHKNISLCYMKMEQRQQCIDHCQQVLSIEPNNIKILYRIGKAYLSQKNYQTAQKYLKRGYAVDPFQNQIMKALQEVQIMRYKQNNKEPFSKKSDKKNQTTIKNRILFIVFFPIYVFVLMCKFFISKLEKVVETLENKMSFTMKSNIGIEQIKVQKSQKNQKDLNQKNE